MGKKRKAEEPSEDTPPTVLDNVEGFWQEFGQTLEHLRASKAIIVVTLDRASGEVEVDDTLSTPAETWFALDVAASAKAERLAMAPPDED